MPYILATDFDVPPYQLPKLEEESEDFQDFVTLKEDEILREMLGQEMYERFLAGMQEVYPLQGWTDLQDGAEYTVGTEKYLWVGLKKMLLPVIYSEWLAFTAYHNSGVGRTMATLENGDTVNLSHEIAKAWNEFAIIAGYNYCMENTLFGFLTCSDNYDFFKNPNGSVYFKSLGTKNIFNL